MSTLNRVIAAIQEKLRNFAIKTGVLQEKLRRFEARRVDRHVVKNLVPALLRDIESSASAGTWSALRKAEMMRRLAATYSEGLSPLRARIETAVERAAEVEFQRGLEGRELLPAEIRKGGLALGTADADEIRRRVAEAKLGAQSIRASVDATFAGLPERQATRAGQIIEQAYIEGENPRQAARRVVRELKPEVLTMTRRRAETMTRTAMLAAANEVRDAQTAADAALYKGVQWVATLDARTTRVCGALDGKFFKMGEGPRPPLHFNCRSTTIPVMKSAYELGLSDDPADDDGGDGRMERQTYEEWLAKQPRQEQDEILGAGLADDFRSGRVKLEETVDRFGADLSHDAILQGRGGGLYDLTQAKDDLPAGAASKLSKLPGPRGRVISRR